MQNKHGGKREGSGRKPKEETTTINFRLPKSRIEYLKDKYPNFSKMFNDWQSTL